MAYTPYLKCHVHNELTGLRRVYAGIGSLVCIINFLITPVGMQCFDEVGLSG